MIKKKSERRLNESQSKLYTKLSGIIENHIMYVYCIVDIINIDRHLSQVLFAQIA